VFKALARSRTAASRRPRHAGDGAGLVHAPAARAGRVRARRAGRAASRGGGRDARARGAAARSPRPCRERRPADVPLDERPAERRIRATRVPGHRGLPRRQAGAPARCAEDHRAGARAVHLLLAQRREFRRLRQHQDRARRGRGPRPRVARPARQEEDPRRLRGDRGARVQRAAPHRRAPQPAAPRGAVRPGGSAPGAWSAAPSRRRARSWPSPGAPRR
jgi:hypothetical protein